MQLLESVTDFESAIHQTISIRYAGQCLLEDSFVDRSKLIAVLNNLDGSTSDDLRWQITGFPTQ